MPVNSFDNYPMNWKPVLHDRRPPIYTRLARQLADDIRTGVLKPGDKMPPQRELADFLDLHLSTITRVYKLCEEQGLICAKVGQGTFVSSDVNISGTLVCEHSDRDYIQMGTIMPPYNGNELVVDFIKSVLTQPDIQTFLEYRSPAGTDVQRRTISNWLQRVGVSAGPENILFATGSQNATCAAVLGLFKTGDRIGITPLSFAGLKGIAKMIGVQLVPLPVLPGSGDKLKLESLKQFCRTENIKGLYLIPDQNNPTTHSLTDEERRAVADAANELGLIILEDAINRMCSEDAAAPIYAYAPKQTIYIFSTSKFLSAGLRVAFMAVPPEYREALGSALYNINLMVSPLNLEIVNRIFNTDLVDKLVDAKKQELRERNELVNEALRGYDVEGALTCQFRWLHLPDKWTGKDFEEAADKAGVQVFCAERFTIGQTAAPKAVRICISAPKNKEELLTGLTRLKNILEQ